MTESWHFQQYSTPTYSKLAGTSVKTVTWRGCTLTPEYSRPDGPADTHWYSIGYSSRNLGLQYGGPEVGGCGGFDLSIEPHQCMCELGFVHSRLTRPPLASRALFIAACTLHGENNKISIVACD